MARTISAGIDVGTYEVKVVVAEEVFEKDKHTVKVIGTGLAESRGLHNGYVVNPAEAAESIREAVNAAEKNAGTRIKRAFFSVGGIGLGSVTSSGAAVISRADMEITDRDMSAALEAAEAAIPPAALQNKKILNSVPLEYKLDGKTAWGRVEGLKASKLEVKALFITCLDHHIKDLLAAIEGARMEAIDLVAAPFASSFVTLSKKEKKAGCILANFGAESISIVVYEDGIPVSLETFPIGSNAITNDIALGLKTTLEDAENIKLTGTGRAQFSKKKLDEIINARLYDCFELVQAHLKKIGRNALLPAGIILTGGGAGDRRVKEFAEDALALPARVAEIHLGPDDKNKEPKTATKDNRWAVACGLAIFGFKADGSERTVGPKSIDKFREGSRQSFRALTDWISHFLP